MKTKSDKGQTDEEKIRVVIYAGDTVLFDGKVRPALLVLQALERARNAG